MSCCGFPEITEQRESSLRPGLCWLCPHSAWELLPWPQQCGRRERPYHSTWEKLTKLTGESIYFSPGVMGKMLVFQSSPKDMLREREKHWCNREILISCLLHTSLPGIKPAIEVCVLTRNWTSTFWYTGRCSSFIATLAGLMGEILATYFFIVTKQRDLKCFTKQSFIFLIFLIFFP